MFHKDDPEYNHNQVGFYSLDLLISSNHFLRQFEDSIDCSFVYDEHFDTYLCPENQDLTYRTTTREAYRGYKSAPNICVSCLLLSQCPPNKNHQEVVTRHIWGDALEICEDIRHQTGMKERYQNRKETTERLLGTVKECHNLRYTGQIGKHKMEDKIGGLWRIGTPKTGKNQDWEAFIYCQFSDIFDTLSQNSPKNTKKRALALFF